MTPEGKLKKKVKALLDEFGAWHCSPMGGSYGRAGVPDILACVNRWFLAIETKAGNNAPTKLQRYELDRVSSAGGVAIVVNEYSLPALRDLLKNLTKKTC